MYKIISHPIIEIAQSEDVFFEFCGKQIPAKKGFTIAAALHQAGYPVHSHSIEGRNRSLECGIGKCGACEMIVDGKVERICVKKVDGVKRVEMKGSQKFFEPSSLSNDTTSQRQENVFKTEVVIVGAGPAGLAVRETLNQYGVANIVIDSNDRIGGQFNMQTHQFFFYEKEKHFGGERGFDIAAILAGENHDDIFLNSFVWDILEDKRIAVKNIVSRELFYVDATHIVVATGAVPFMPSFKNDDLPGVYTAAVVQKMMNCELTLLGKKILTIGAGNIGYLTSYQAMQAGASVVAIIEAMPREGGFPVQANRVRRLGIPVLTSKLLLEAIPNEDGTGIKGAIVADCENFKPIEGTEQVIEGIDVINVCTGLMPDNQLLIKGDEIFGKRCYGVGDAVRIGEGTSAVLRGRQCAYEILQSLNVRYNYEDYLQVSSDYISSQQHPVRILDEAFCPPDERRAKRPFVRPECLYGFACNPCRFACKYGAITKNSTSDVPHIDYEKCIGCMDCVSQCPGLAIFGYNVKKKQVSLPFEYDTEGKTSVLLVDNDGKTICDGKIIKVKANANKTSVATIECNCDEKTLITIKGFILKEKQQTPLQISPLKKREGESKTFICHCEDVSIDKLLSQIGSRKSISVDELKHTTRLGMGDCRGKRCIPRAKQILASYGIEVVGDATPRAPLSVQVTFGELYDTKEKNIIFNAKNTKIEKVQSFIAGGGIGGSSLFRYMAEAGLNPLMINFDRGASWRNIAGGRPAFSNPELADIAEQNHNLFKELQKQANIDYYPIRYVNLAHGDESYKGLEKAMQWSDAYMVEPKDFQKEISPYFNKKNKNYIAAQITNNCWQATPGKTIDLLRKIGLENGGSYIENAQLVEVYKQGKEYHILVKTASQYTEYITEVFVNALGFNAEKFAKQLGIETGLFPVKHQAFITKRLPLIGKDNNQLDMVIDRRHYKGFSSIYGQQLRETGQIIGCASPLFDSQQTGKTLKTATQDFLEIVSEIFAGWIPELKNISVQASWSGYYTEPRYIIDPELGLFIGLRGHGFMLSQYLAKMYVDKLQGKPTADYFDKLKLHGEGIAESALK
ncbi:MAG: FAD-dependent oxidoreductase [Bacteroidales bacterium]|jgi:glycine/D-amino acid oxidase-like deaminating enzyme/Fe-S-cluster-containing hydrogenase component 2/ferredoxin|nr:FAD-dependent oxidoreductase [Bacteroidales bacterium]